MRPKLSWKAAFALRMTLMLGALIAGGALIRSEIAHGRDLDRQIAQKTEEAARLADEGEKARRYYSEDEPLVREVEARLLVAAPLDLNGFKAFCLAQAEGEALELRAFRCDPAGGEVGRPGAGQEKAQSSSLKAASSPEYAEAEFYCLGRGSYGGILRFVDKISGGKVLVSIDRFGLSRTSSFYQNFPTVREDKPEPETEGDSHSFLIQGRVQMTPAKGGEVPK